MFRLINVFTYRRLSIILLLLLFLVSQGFSQSLPRDSITKIKSGVVYIEMKKQVPVFDEPISYSGTGFFISDKGYIITAYHVIQPSIFYSDIPFPAFLDDLRIIINSGTKQQKAVKGNILMIDRDQDLAIIAVDKKETTSLDLVETDELYETEPLWVFGYPYGEEFSIIQRGPEISINKGNITALRHNDKGILQAIQFDGAVNPGNSGGPTINQDGEVIGLVTSVYGNSQINFAVPVHYINKMIKEIAIHKNGYGTCTTAITTYPAGASIYIDNDFIGTSPVKNLTLTKGYHTLWAIKKGYTSWIDEFVLMDNRKLYIALKQNRDFTIMISKNLVNKTPHVKIKPYNTGRSLFTETFNNEKDFETWEQSTGGDDNRTWYLQDGILHQFDSDALLHTIYLGDTSWENYSMKADVRIQDEHDDSRAGLVFRDTEDGFYLFRIHKETDKAQLAYHCKNPFGWFILKEKQLNTDVKDNWYTLRIQGLDNQLKCFFNDTSIFSITNDLAEKGRIGFYSVESKASFDNLTVNEILHKDNKRKEKFIPSSRMQSFWFTDLFNLKSIWWYPYNKNNAGETTWYFTEGGCVQTADDDVERAIEFTKYRIKDFTLNLLVSLAKGEENSTFEIFFRKNGKSYHAIKFGKKDRKVKLIQVKKGKTTVLTETKAFQQLFGQVLRILIAVKDDTVTCQVFNTPLITYKKKSLKGNAGRFGVSVKHLKCILQNIYVSQPVD